MTASSFRLRAVRLTVCLALVSVMSLVPSPATAALLTWSELLARPQPAFGPSRIAYGKEKGQFGDLWLPQGPGPHPVALLVHGGCWQAALPGLELLNHLAEGLRQAGFAVWNLEYRRLGEPGGGFPGTFEDVAQGVDHLRTLAVTHRLDLARVVVAGHSAGGHLALWAAGRRNLPQSGALAALSRNPLPVAGVVGLAAISDLARYRSEGLQSCGGPAVMDPLTGANRADRPDPYADLSPPRLLPLRVRQILLSGEFDKIVPADFGAAYASQATAKGDAAQAIALSGIGHFELIDPQSATAWPQILAAFQSIVTP
jgi:acetyl esterase/lipase